MPATQSDKSRSTQLLLPHLPRLVLKKTIVGFQIVEMPQWLRKVLADHPKALILEEIELIETLIPGILDLAGNVLAQNRAIQGFQTTFENGDETQPLTLDAEPRPDAPAGTPIVSILIQDPLSQPEAEGPEAAPPGFLGLIGQSPAMIRVFNKIRLYGAVDAPVIILGETGAGKEGVAHALHLMSRRAKREFVPVNCTAISENLFESELFGHEKGSFTGAVKTHKGRFERAHQGSLFLDEIGDLPLSSQTKLLRTLEDGTIERVGGETPIKVDVRIIAATNKNLEKEILRERFRADLFYRISALQIHLPPLRERPEDIPLLVRHFTDLLNKKYGRAVHGLSPEALKLLQQYQWPGNVRELRNLLERLFAENSTDLIGLRALNEWFKERQQVARTLQYDPNVTILPHRHIIELGMDGNESGNGNGGLRPSSGAIATNANGKPVPDADAIRRAYAQANGNITKAASLLGIHKATLYRHLKSLQLTRENIFAETGKEETDEETVKIPSPPKTD